MTVWRKVGKLFPTGAAPAVWTGGYAALPFAAGGEPGQRRVYFSGRDVANRSHIAAGSWFGKLEQMQRTLKQGARFVVYANDGAFLRESLEQSFAQLRTR